MASISISARTGLHVGSATIPRETTRFALILVVHIPLALLLYRLPGLAALHALATLAVGIWAALRWKPEKVAAVAAYVVGAEVLWRMAGAPIFWEFGKYAIVLIFIVATVRLGRSARWDVLPILYFAVLTPSIIVILHDPSVTLRGAMQMVSFNLSGPLSLAVSAWFLSQIRPTPDDMRRLFTAALGPLVGIGAITLFTTYTATALSFTDESNFVTSGGFGPNQVSLVLGLGVLFGVLYALDNDTPPASRSVALIATLFLAMQSAMTFSRGGLYSAGGAVMAATWYLLRDRRTRTRLIGLMVVAGAIGAFVILPHLERLTNGELTTRFTDVGSSHRSDIMREDVRIWFEHPLLGTGPGGARKERRTSSSLAHTEYTRVLAEHGILGVFALILLAAMCLRQFAYDSTPRGKALMAAFSAWSLLSMMHADMRVAAMGFVFGLGQASFVTRTDAQSPDRQFARHHSALYPTGVLDRTA